jgi:apolipoprotein N-acyltransferase
MGKKTKQKQGEPRPPLLNLPALAWWVGGGALLGLPFAVPALEPLVFVGSIPWLIALEKTPRNLALHAYIGNWACGVVSLWWMTDIAWVVLPVTVLWYSAWVPVWAVLTGPVADRLRLPRWLASPMAICVHDLGMRLSPPSLDAHYSLSGMLFWRMAPLNQLVELGSVTLLSFLAFLSSAAILALVRGLRAHGFSAFKHREVRSPVLALLALLAFGLAFGSWRLASLDLQDGPTIALVQGNVQQSERLGPANAMPVIRKHARLSLELESPETQVDLVAWPETTASFALEQEPELVEQLRVLANRIGAPLILGAIGLNPDSVPQAPSNSAFVIDPESGLSGRHDKRVLVPGAETLLLIDHVPFLRDPISDFLSKNMGFRPYLVRGAVSEPLIAGELRVGVMICYGDMVPSLAAELQRRGADLLLVLSNEAWFGTMELGQHMAISTVRSIETRLPLARATNTGLTCVVDPGGRVVRQLPRDQDGVLVATLQTTELTPLPRFFRLGFRALMPLVWVVLVLRWAWRSRSAAAA